MRTRWMLAIAALVACACGPRENVTVLRIANWGGAGEDGPFQQKINEINRAFEEAHPGVKVVIEGIPGEYVQKMLLNHVADAMPDVMVIDASSAAVFIDNGLLSDLSPRFNAEPGLREQFWPNVLGTYSRPGKQFGVPNDFTPMVLYYNKRHFDEAGLPYPKAGWTREEFRQMAKKLRKGDRYGFSFTNWMPGWVMWLWNGGGDVISTGDAPTARGTFDSPENAATFAFLRDLIVKDKAAPSLSQTAALGIDLFAGGRSSMTISGHWSMVSYAASTQIKIEDVGVVPIPFDAANGERTMGEGSQTVLYMAAYGIAEKSRNKDLAWDYVKHWTSYKIQSDYNTTGIAVCARKDVSQEAAKRNPLSGDFLPIIPTGRAPYGSFVIGYEMVEKVGTSVMDTILNNPERDIQAELTKAAIRIDGEFAKSR